MLVRVLKQGRNVLVEPVGQLAQERAGLKVGIGDIASIVANVAAELIAGTAVPASIASGSDGQQNAEDPQDSIVPQDVPATLEDFSDVDHFIFSFSKK
jgi:hypothetical protein